MTRRGGPGAKSRATSTPPSATADSTVATDRLAVDAALVAGAGGDLWALLFDGVFVLARPCAACGRMLTANRSKAAGMGPRCAHRANTEAVTR